jgi:hypothetical protein
MLATRYAFQVRTVPERVMEWLLLFVPLDVFEAGIRRFVFDAKRYTLAAAFVGIRSWWWLGSARSCRTQPGRYQRTLGPKLAS